MSFRQITFPRRVSLELLRLSRFRGERNYCIAQLFTDSRCNLGTSLGCGFSLSCALYVFVPRFMQPCREFKTIVRMSPCIAIECQSKLWRLEKGNLQVFCMRDNDSEVSYILAINTQMNKCLVCQFRIFDECKSSKIFRFRQM